MFAESTKNTLAKIAILLWIVLLLGISGIVVRIAIMFDINSFFGLVGNQMLPTPIIHEVQVILLMFAISILGGVSFMIKDFYRSIKYSNLYEMALSDYRSGKIPFEEFQRLTPIEIYTGRFNYTWIYWFLIQPVLSSVLGVIAFFIARSGLGVLQGAGNAPDLSIQSLYLYAVLTFLAGFSSHKFIAWLDRLADKIFSSTLPDRYLDTKNQVQATAASDRSKFRETFELPADKSQNIIGSEVPVGDIQRVEEVQRSGEVQMVKVTQRNEESERNEESQWGGEEVQKNVTPQKNEATQKNEVAQGVEANQKTVDATTSTQSTNGNWSMKSIR